MSYFNKMAPKKTYHHGDLKNALTLSGLQLIATEGAQAVTLRDVAKKAGVSHAALYRHYDSKEALLAAIAEEGFRLLHQELIQAADRGGDATLARFQNMGVAYVCFAVSHPSYFQVMFQSQWQTAATDSLKTAGTETFSLLLGIIERCQKEDVVRAGDVEELATLIWAGLHGLASLLSNGHDLGQQVNGVEKVAWQLTSNLFLGLKI